MKKLILVSIFGAISSIAFSQNVRYQRGYYKPSTNTYVNPHIKKTNNTTNWDNFSTDGNENPYNGQNGAKAKDYSTDALNYGSGQTIYQGERGGQYYYNSKGKKIYVPKRY